MKIKWITTLLGSIIFYICTALATPKHVIIIRHADKPLNSNCLSLQGLARAAALSQYLPGTPIYNNPSISHIFAAFPDKEDPSIRSIQTCNAIADHLRLSVNTAFHPKKINDLAKEILTNPSYNNSTVLICWEHKAIQPLIVALGGEDPGKWPDDVFDQVYMLTYNDREKPKFQKYLQKLMFGDRATFEDTPRPLKPIPMECPKTIKNIAEAPNS